MCFVVDDGEAIRGVLTTLLECEAYDVCASPDLAGGLRLLADGPFNLVVTDLLASPFAPDAFLLAHRLAEAAPAIPIVLATALKEADELQPVAGA